MNISDWWAALTILQKILWLVALPSSIVFVIQLLFMVIGGDSDTIDDADFDVNGDHDFSGIDGHSFHLFSLKSLMSFFMLFGWSGLTAISKGMISLWAILSISFFSGLVMMLFTAWVLYLLMKLQHSGTLKMKNAIGKVGEVYLSIPAKKKGMGKIQVKVQGGLKTLNAVTEEAKDIKNGTFVKVIDIEADDTLIVRPKR